MSSQKRIFNSLIASFLVISQSLIFATAAIADEVVIVNVDNFARAETAAQIGRALELTEGINKWGHYRQPTPLDKQNVIRMNRDTLYSFALVDISKGATLTLPDPGKRYMSVMVVNEDHYINKVFHEGGTYKLTMEEFDTPYVILSVRILANSLDSDDIEIATALQDQMKIEAASDKPYTPPPLRRNKLCSNIQIVAGARQGYTRYKAHLRQEGRGNRNPAFTWNSIWLGRLTCVRSLLHHKKHTPYGWGIPAYDK